MAEQIRSKRMAGPTCPSEVRMVQDPKPRALRRPLMSHRLYLVEDHPAMRGAYEALIARSPDLDLCGTAVTAEEALDHLHANTCDILITDVTLPGMDGVALTSRVAQERPGLPIVVVSVDEGHRVRALEAGATTFLSKNGLARTLVPTVLDLLQRVPQGGQAAS